MILNLVRKKNGENKLDESPNKFGKYNIVFIMLA